MKTKNKISAYLIVISLFLVSVPLFLAVDGMGFPDGHLTELDLAEQPLFYIAGILGI